MNEMEVLALAAAAKKKRNQSEQPKPAGQRVREFFLGDDDPNTLNAGERIGAALNKAGEAMTFGLIGDEASAAAESVLPGVEYAGRRDHYRRQEEVLERDNPGLALGAEVAGGLVAPVGAVGALPKIAKGLTGFRRGVALSGASAAGTGTLAGVYGFAEGEGGASERVRDTQAAAAQGAMIGAAIPVAGAGIQRIADSLASARQVRSLVRNAPSTKDLRTQGSAAYQAIDDAGVQIKPEAFSRTTDKIASRLQDRTGFDPLPGSGGLTPKSARVMQVSDEMSAQMKQEPTAALPFKAVDQLRRRAGAPAASPDKTEAAAGMEIIAGLDDMVKGLGPDDVTAGDLETLQTLLPKARDTWARMSRSQLLDDAIENAGDYRTGQASGLRAQFQRIVRNPKLSRGFSDAELKMMRRVVNGSLPEQLLNYLGSGLGMLGQIGLGASMGGIPGAALGVAGAAGSRKAAEALTGRNAEIARAIVASGGLRSSAKANPQIEEITNRLLRQGAAVSVPQTSL